MKQHLHFYTLAGRGMQSVALTERTIHSSVERSLATRMQYQLLSGGYTLVRWLEDEQAGIAVSQGQEFILRVKTESLVRDMKTVGAIALVKDIRRDGVDVVPLTGHLVDAEFATPVEKLAEQTPEQDMDAFAYAVWMVGNMDTDADKAAWWSDFQSVWESASERVDAMNRRGVTVGQGFEATGLRAPTGG